MRTLAMTLQASGGLHAVHASSYYLMLLPECRRNVSTQVVVTHYLNPTRVTTGNARALMEMSWTWI